jgi:HAD superfamily, subfamily IIIB (Acid phosphatase)
VSRLALLRQSRSARIIGLAVALSLLTGGVALSTSSSSPSFTPRHADQITNIDILRSQIKNYYGDPTGTGVFGTDSNYARETDSVADAAQRWLSSHRHWRWYHGSRTKAIVLDVDDTTLTTWNYEIFSNWAYNPTTNATYVNGQLFPATPGMVEMVNWAANHGYAVFFITGRPASQEAATLGNLTADGVGVDAGYPAPTTLPDGEDGLFTKPDVIDYPPYLQAACASDPGGKCTTIHYKSATRAHIESMGYDIVANFGDQYSDLTGGYADRSFKMPNPNYYLP